MACRLLVIGPLTFCAWACVPHDAGAPATPEATPTPIATVDPVSYGNGVFYFPATGEEYLASLAKFYEENGKRCDLQGFTEKVVELGFSNKSRTRHTETTGFILRCHDLAVEAQNMTVP